MSQTPRNDMTPRQRRTLNRLSRIHGTKNRYHAAGMMLGLKPRDVRRRGLSDVEAATVIQQLARGTSMDGASGYASGDKSLLRWALIAGGACYVLSFEWRWLLAVGIVAALIALFLVIRIIRGWFDNLFWWTSKKKRDETYYDTSL